MEVSSLASVAGAGAGAAAAPGFVSAGSLVGAVAVAGTGASNSNIDDDH